MLIKPAKEVKFVEQFLEDDFISLPEKHPIKKGIMRAINNLKVNVFCGEKIEKRLIPWKYLKKYGVDNLWWYPLPDGWRLVYSIATNDSEILAVIIEYFDHKNYAKRFNYKT